MNVPLNNVSVLLVAGSLYAGNLIDRVIAPDEMEIRKEKCGYRKKWVLHKSDFFEGSNLEKMVEKKVGYLA